VNKREKILAAGVGTIAILYGAHWLYQIGYERPLETRKAEQVRLKNEISKRELDLAKNRKASRELDRWQAQSLPSNTEVAQGKYLAWLVKLVGSSELTNPKVDPSAPMSRKGMYDSLIFSVRGRGTLKQLTKFLFEFYRADHLHQIQTLTLTPQPRTDELEISISIEALSLDNSKNKEELSEAVSDRLASNDLVDYQSIVERNLFGVGGGEADDADFAYLTAVIEVNGEPEAWFTLRASGKLLKVRQTQSFDIGPFHGVVDQIHENDVVLLCDDERWLISVGENLMQASTLPPEF